MKVVLAPNMKITMHNRKVLAYASSLGKWATRLIVPKSQTWAQCGNKGHPAVFVLMITFLTPCVLLISFWLCYLFFVAKSWLNAGRYPELPSLLDALIAQKMMPITRTTWAKSKMMIHPWTYWGNLASQAGVERSSLTEILSNIGESVGLCGGDKDRCQYDTI